MSARSMPIRPTAAAPARRLGGLVLGGLVLASVALWSVALWSDGGALAAESTDTDPRVSLNTGATYRSWTVTDSTGNDSKVSQFYVPFGATVPIGPTFDLVAFGAYASTKLDLNEAGHGTLKGVTDFRLKGFWRPGNRFFLAAGVNLPVGKHLLQQGALEGAPRALRPAHDDENAPVLHDVEIAQVIWSPIFGLPAKRMGEGLNIDLSTGVAFPLSPTATLGLGAGYILKGEYDFIQTADDTRRFKPGAEASGSIGLDFRPNEGTLIRFDVAGRTFGEDTQSDRKVFKAARQIELDAYFLRDTGAWNFLLHARDVAKGKDEFIEENGDNDLLRTQHDAVSSLWLSGDAYRRLGETLSVGATVEFGSFGKSDLTLSDGHTLSFGPALRLGRSGGTNGVLRVSRLTGSAEGGDVDLSGFDLSGVLSLSF